MIELSSFKDNNNTVKNTLKINIQFLKSYQKKKRKVIIDLLT